MKKHEDFTYLRERMGDRINDYTEKEERPDGSVIYVFGELNTKKLIKKMLALISQRLFFMWKFTEDF